MGLQQVEEEKRARLEEERARVREKYQECTFKPPPSKKYVAPTEEAIVRQNAASVLREDALLKKKQAKEAQILKRYEEDLHDGSEFQAWKQKIKLQDDLDEENRVRQRMVEMQLA